MSTSRAWKNLERRVCRALASNRRPSVGRSGWARGSDDDGTCAFAVECKYTQRPQLRGEWLAQARKHSAGDGRPWLLAIGTHRSPRIIAVIDFDELVALATEAGRIPASTKGGTMLHETPQPPTDPPPEEPKPDDGGDDGG